MFIWTVNDIIGVSVILGTLYLVFKILDKFKKDERK